MWSECRASIRRYPFAKRFNQTFIVDDTRKKRADKKAKKAAKAAAAKPGAKPKAKPGAKGKGKPKPGAKGKAKPSQVPMLEPSLPPRLTPLQLRNNWVHILFDKNFCSHAKVLSVHALFHTSMGTCSCLFAVCI